MAKSTPDPVSVNFDYRSQIIENCEFFAGRKNYISIVTKKSPSGQWVATVMQWTGHSRQAVIASDSSDSLQEAIISLLDKSSEATHLFVKTNGHDLPPNLDSDDMSDTASEASSGSSVESLDISAWENSDDEQVITPATSTKEVGSASLRCAKKSRNKSGKSKPARGSKSYDSDDDSIIATRPARVSAGSRCPPPPPTRTGTNGTPAPPLVFRSFPSAPPLQPPQQPPLRPVTGLGMPPPGFRASYPPPPPLPSSSLGSRTFDVRLAIKWINHGEQFVLENSRPNASALREKALNYVLNNMSTFDNVTSLDQSPMKVWKMHAVIKRALVGNEAYNMLAYRGEDLSRLLAVAGATVIPRIEIEVDCTRPLGPGPVPGPGPRLQAPGSAPVSVSAMR